MRQFVPVFALLISGCTLTWIRPNTSSQQMHQDYAECEITAYGKYPANMVHLSSESPREPSRDVDANTILRDEETKYCMRQRGYDYGHAK